MTTEITLSEKYIIKYCPYCSLELTSSTLTVLYYETKLKCNNPICCGFEVTYK